jgi:Fe-S-cluster containining protein
MQFSQRIDSGDQALILAVDAALAEAARKSGPWLVCRPGCTQCCISPFPITPLDAHRLRRGLAELEARDPQRAARIRQRAAAARNEDDEPCPALDPESGLCELYAARPMICRTFGPAVRCASGALGICELCFQGASDAEIAACEVDIDPDDLEPALLKELEQITGARDDTLVASALAG